MTTTIETGVNTTPLKAYGVDETVYCWQVLVGNHWCGGTPDDRWAKDLAAVELLMKHCPYVHRLVTRPAYSDRFEYGPSRARTMKLETNRGRA